MSIFQNKFFSAAGQKERLSNAAQTIKAAVTGKGVTANTSSKTLNKVLSTAASNPFITAGIAAGGITAGKSILSSAANKAAGSALGSSLLSRSAATVAKSSLLKTGVIAGATGLVAGSLLSKSGSIRQTAQPQQISTPTQVAEPKQDTTQSIRPTSFEDAGQSFASQYGAGNVLNQNKYLRTQQDTYTYAQPSQTVTPSQSVFQDQQTGQDATSSGNNWIIPAAIIAAALLWNRG